MLHAWVFDGVPEHVPPKASVTNFVRFFVWVPPPHGLVQADHDFQDSHVQSTRKCINNQIKFSKKLLKFVYPYLKSDISHNVSLTYKDLNNNLHMIIGYI